MRRRPGHLPAISLIQLNLQPFDLDQLVAVIDHPSVHIPRQLTLTRPSRPRAFASSSCSASMSAVIGQDLLSAISEVLGITPATDVVAVMPLTPQTARELMFSSTNTASTIAGT